MQEELKIALIKAGLSQLEVAMELGVHPATISRIVNGLYVPPTETQQAFRKVLGKHARGLKFGYRLKDSA